MMSEIKNLNDVKCFMKLLVTEGTNAHPDEDFNNYVNMESGEPAYTAEQAALRNALMEQCFNVCKLAGQDVYSVMQEVFLIETGLDKYIPLPAQV